jgi:hypothetical protein
MLGVTLRDLFPPIFRLVLLKELAALWAAEIIDEKKPPEGFWFAVGVGSPLSWVGVKGADTMLESLLGPMFCEFDRLLLFALMF